MKKTFSLLFIAAVLSLNIGYAQQNQTQPPVENATVKYPAQPPKPNKEELKRQFEQRLQLTDKQKEQAKVIHQKGREKIKPVMMQIDYKRQEIEMIRLSRMSERMQKEKTDQLMLEIKDLEKQADTIRKENTQEFEKILTKKQKAELEKMKAEGRARFAKNHPPRPPFQGLGTPGFLLRPLLPPPAHDNNIWK